MKDARIQVGDVVAVWTMVFFSGTMAATVASTAIAPWLDAALGLATAGGLLLLLGQPGALASLLAATRRQWTTVLLVVWALLSATWSVAPSHTLLEGLRLLALTAFALHLGETFSCERTLRAAAMALLAVLATSYVFVWARPELGVVTAFPAQTAWRGVFVDKNALGLAAALGALTAVAGARRAPARSALLFALALPLFVLSRSAGSVVAFAAALLASALLALLRRLASVRRRALAAIAITVTLLLAGAGTARLVLGALGRDLTLTGRTALWLLIAPWLEQRPVLGYGYRAFWTVARAPIRAQFEARPSEIPFAEFPRDAHNGFVETASDLGATGVLALLLALAAAAAAALRGRNEEQGSHAHFWPSAVVVAVTVNNLTETSFLQTQGAAAIAWVMFVIASGLLRRCSGDAAGAG